MLSVQPNSFQLRNQASFGPQSIEPQPQEVFEKNVLKKSQVTPLKIAAGIAIFLLLVLGSYKLYTVIEAPPAKSLVEAAHELIITVADSSSQNGKGSSSGSSSSKGSRNSDKPKQGSQPAGKSVISSVNNGITGSNGGDDREPNDGDKNKKILDDNKKTEGTGTDKDKNKDDTTTDQESESVQSENSGDFAVEGLMWTNRNQQTPVPLIGSIRN